MPEITNETVLAVQALLDEMATKYTAARDKLFTIMNNLGADDITNTDTLFYLINKVGTIETGITPTGTVTFDTNGTYDVTEKASVIVAVPTNDTSSLPTLNTPSISRSGDTITVTNPSTNGNFNRNIKLYSNGALVATNALSSQGGSTTFSIKTFAVGDYEIVAKCSNSSYFKDSNATSTTIVCSCFSISNTVTNGTSNNSAITIADGQSHTETITPNGGWWLPEHISVKSDNVTLVEGTDYAWDMYTGVLGLVANGDLVLTITCESTPKLKTPEIVFFDEDTIELEVEYVKYAQSYSYLIDGVEATTYTIDTSVDTDAVLASQLATPTLATTSSYGVKISESTSCYGLTFDLYIDSVYRENIEIGDNI